MSVRESESSAWLGYVPDEIIKLHLHDHLKSMLRASEKGEATPRIWGLLPKELFKSLQKLPSIFGLAAVLQSVISLLLMVCFTWFTEAEQKRQSRFDAGLQRGSNQSTIFTSGSTSPTTPPGTTSRRSRPSGR